MLIILGISAILFIGIMAAMVYFVFKYSRKKRDTVSNISHNTALEVVWTAIPVGIVMVMFWYGFVGFNQMRKGPEDAFTVKVTGRMWSWMFTYENGIQAADVLRIPVGEPIKFVITSQDVIHSFFIPAFRVKWDAVPGRETVFYTTPQRTGTFDIMCAEYCGLQHAYMLSKVKVMPRDEFDRWYRENEPKDQELEAAPSQEGLVLPQPETAEQEGVTEELPTEGEEPAPAGGSEAGQTFTQEAKPGGPEAPHSPQQQPAGTAQPAGGGGALAQRGETLAKQYACMSCHTTDGSKLVGPSFKGVFGSMVTVVTDGKERQVRADEAYLRKSIRQPNEDIVKGYQPLMPPQELSDSEMEAIIAFIKAQR